MDERTDGRMDVWRDGLMDELMDGCTGGWMNGRMGQVDVWMDGRADERILVASRASGRPEAKTTTFDNRTKKEIATPRPKLREAVLDLPWALEGPEAQKDHF